jgi:hypothetical protein
MCFSAGASFAGGAVISAIGITAIRKVHKPSHGLFASIPLLFGFQQFAEGVVWMELQGGGDDRILTAATYLFLAIALVIWPLVIPLSVRRMEEIKERKKYLSVILYAAILLSSYYLFCLLRFDVTPQINKFHIQYINDFPYFTGFFAFGIYVAVTITPLFISTVKRMYLFGILIFFSCFVTGILYREFLTSVWCFFAAISSFVIYWIVSSEKVTDEIPELQEA